MWCYGRIKAKPTQTPDQPKGSVEVHPTNKAVTGSTTEEGERARRSEEVGEPGDAAPTKPRPGHERGRSPQGWYPTGTPKRDKRIPNAIAQNENNARGNDQRGDRGKARHPAATAASSKEAHTKTKIQGPYTSRSKNGVPFPTTPTQQGKAGPCSSDNE